jgi:hypothetical protein
MAAPLMLSQSVSSSTTPATAGPNWETLLIHAALCYLNLPNRAPAFAGVEVTRGTPKPAPWHNPTLPLLHSPQTAFGLRLVNLLHAKHVPSGDVAR